MEMARRNGDFFWSSRGPNCFGWIHRELQDYESATVFDRQGAELAHRLDCPRGRSGRPWRNTEQQSGGLHAQLGCGSANPFSALLGNADKC
jgi:hypothetical protein